MPKLKDDTINKLYYRMGEVSEIIGVAPSLLRFWEKEFDCLKNIEKNRKGDRLYTNKNIEDLKMIFHLVKEKGYTLNGANEYLSGYVNEKDKKMEIVKSLEILKRFFEELKQNL